VSIPVLGFFVALAFVPAWQSRLAVVIAITVLFTAMYAAIGIAVLKHRLYDIGEILASAITVRQADTDLAEPVGLKQLKGRQELVEAYRIRWLDVPTAQQPGKTAYAE
jgi:hypothetical protein